MFLRTLLFLLTTVVSAGPISAADKLIIAARGAGHDLIDHSLPALTLAIANGVEYLELQVVMTADDALLVFAHPTLNQHTDVARVFPDRHREDGGYHVIDFTLGEVRQLRLSRPGPTGSSLGLAIATLEETLALIDHLEDHFNREIGVLVEIGHPRLHLAAGKDISSATLDGLADFVTLERSGRLFIQSIDPDELQRIHQQLMPERQLDLPLIQILAPPRQPPVDALLPDGHAWLLTNSGLRIVAGYAWGIAFPSAALLGEHGRQVLDRYLTEAAKYGLRRLVMASDARPTPAQEEPQSLLDAIFTTLEADGIYTNSYQAVRRYLHQRDEDGRRQADLPPFFSDQKLQRPAPSGTPDQIWE